MFSEIDTGGEPPRLPTDWVWWVLITVVVIAIIAIILISPAGTFPLRR